MRFPTPSFTLIGLVYLCVIVTPLRGQSDSLPESSKWSMGLHLGVSQVQGDVHSRLNSPQVGLFAQKEVLKHVDVRMQVLAGQHKGMDLRTTQGFLFNTAWNASRDPNLFYDTSRLVVLNYRQRFLHAGFWVKLNLNQWFSPEGWDKWDLYGLVGLGILVYDTRINAEREAEGMLYDFSSLQPVIETGDEAAIRQALDDLLDDTYETAGQRQDLTSAQLGRPVFRQSHMTGGGVSWQISPHLRMSSEAQVLFVGGDLMDGQQWNDDNSQSESRDRIFSISIATEFLF